MNSSSNSAGVHGDGSAIAGAMQAIEDGTVPRCDNGLSGCSPQAGSGMASSGADCIGWDMCGAGSGAAEREMPVIAGNVSSCKAAAGRDAGDSGCEVAVSGLDSMCFSSHCAFVGEAGVPDSDRGRSAVGNGCGMSCCDAGLSSSCGGAAFCADVVAVGSCSSTLADAVAGTTSPLRTASCGAGATGGAAAFVGGMRVLEACSPATAAEIASSTPAESVREARLPESREMEGFLQAKAHRNVCQSTTVGTSMTSCVQRIELKQHFTNRFA